MALLHVLPWVLGSVVVGVAIGFYLGATARLAAKPSAKKDETTLKVLTSVLAAAEQLNSDVGHHNVEIKEVGRHLVDLEVDDRFRGVQQSLLGEIAGVLEANKQLEDDLDYARLRIEEQAQEIDRTRKEARKDELSGVGNRKAFDEKLQMAVARWRRESKPFVLALCDVDHFKWVNDTHGHQAGDRVVAGMGELLHKCVRGHDFVSRYGGDEFAIILSGVTEVEGADIMERIRANVSSCNFGLRAGGEQAAVTLSVGVAGPCEDATAESIIERADQALYKAKQAGRNKVYCFSRDHQAPLAVTGAM